MLSQLIEDSNKSLVTSFGGIFGSLNDGKSYQDAPPKGPPEELPTLTNEELNALQQTVFGEDLHTAGYAYSSIKLIENPEPVTIEMPTVEALDNLNVCGIDGSNQRVERGSFYLVISRASIVNFKYSKENNKPYFYNKNIDASAVTWVDGNVFKEDISLYTTIIRSSEQGANLLDTILTSNSKPFLVRYDPDKDDKSPSSHALGWAVKLQQTLELACLKEIGTTEKTICIKDGPLFSTSVSISDVKQGLAPIYTWDKQVLIACSKRVQDSTMLIEALLKNVALRNHWFKDQNITDRTLKSLAIDALILPRILKPGQRTPLFEAIPVSRKNVVDPTAGGEERLTPLTCYYLSKHKPHTYIRLEVPKIMWDRNQDAVKEAFQIVAWQHELGHRAPLVQLAADERCQLQYEKQILEKQTAAALFKNNLDFPEKY